MKKLLALFLSVLFLLSAACAEEQGGYLVDTFRETFKNYDDAAFGVVMTAMEALWLERDPAPFELKAGVYSAGETFPVGIWSFDLTTQFGEIVVYRDAQAYSAEYRIPQFEQIMGEYSGITSIGSIILNPGQVLVVNGTYNVTPFGGLRK